MAIRTLYILAFEPGGFGLSTRKMVLEQANHNVFKTVTGAETVRLAGMFPFDALLMDTFCDDMDPVEIVAQCRKASPELRVIAVSRSGDCSPELRQAVDLYLPNWEPASCVRTMEVFLNVAA